MRLDNLVVVGNTLLAIVHRFLVVPIQMVADRHVQESGGLQFPAGCQFLLIQIKLLHATHHLQRWIHVVSSDLRWS